MAGRYPTRIGYEEYPTCFGYEENYVPPNPLMHVPTNAPPNPLIHAPPNTPIPIQLNTSCYIWINAPTNVGEGSSSGVMANSSSLEHEIQSLYQQLYATSHNYDMFKWKRAVCDQAFDLLIEY